MYVGKELCFYSTTASSQRVGLLRIHLSDSCMHTSTVVHSCSLPVEHTGVYTITACHMVHVNGDDLIISFIS